MGQDASQSTARLSLEKCPACGYSLRGLPSVHRCPECAFEYDEETSVWRPPRRNLWLVCGAFALLVALYVLGMSLLPRRSGSRSLQDYIADHWVVLYLLAFPAWYAWQLRRRPFVAVGRKSFAIRYRRREVQVIPWGRVRAIRGSTRWRNRILVVAATAETFGTGAEVTESIKIPLLIQTQERFLPLYVALTRTWQAHTEKLEKRARIGPGAEQPTSIRVWGV